MKKNTLAVVTCSVLALLSCVKEVNNEVIIAKDSQALVYDIKINHHSLNDNDTKAVKTGWEAGDVVYIFFSTIASPKHVEMHFDGSSWTTKEITAGTTEGSIGLTTDGTMTAVYMPFGNDAVVSDNTGQFVFNQTKYSYYLSCVNVPYTVSGGVVSGTLDMNVPEGFVQFFLTNASATDGDAVLREAHITPKAVTGINTDGTLIIASKDTGTQMPGFAYGTGDAKGYLFSGELAAGARGTATDYHFNVVVGFSSKVLEGNKTIYRGTPGCYTHRAIKFPVISAWDSGSDESIEFADANFKAYCVTNFDTSGDGEVSYAEALVVTSIDVCTDNITSLGGVEYFTYLQNLKACGSSATYHGLGGLTQWGEDSLLPEPEIGKSVATGKLPVVDVSKLYNLVEVDISRNNTIVDFSTGSVASLKRITCDVCNITALDISGNTALERLRCSYNQLTSMDLASNTAITNVNCSYNQLTSLDVTCNAGLLYLYCSSNHLAALDLTNNTELLNLSVAYNQLASLNIENNIALTSVTCPNNELTSLSLGYNAALKTLDCRNNHLTSFDISHCLALTLLLCDNNGLTSLNVMNNTALNRLGCQQNQLSTLSLCNNTALTRLNCDFNKLSALNIDNNTALVSLNCQHNQLTALDVSHNTSLVEMGCGDNLLTVLDVSNNNGLTSLYCYNNQLTSLDVSDNLSLTWLNCIENSMLTEIWLKTGQSIENLSYDSNVATIKYK